MALSLPFNNLANAKYASIVLDAESGRVLHAVNADTRNYPASLTKMMTLYMTFEALQQGRLSLNQQLPVSRRAEGMSPSKLGLKRGQTIKVKDVVLALVTKSANDAAVVIAESLGGTEVKFAQQMTAKAKELGMSRTSFRNASGLPNRRQLSTARDMAKLSLALIRDYPQYYDMFSTQHFSYGGKKHKNHNNLLRSYEGTDGVKTGYTRASGFNLAASVVRNDRRLIAVVFGGKSSRSRDRHIVKLLDRGFEQIDRAIAEAPKPDRNPFREGEIQAAEALPQPTAGQVVETPAATENRGVALATTGRPNSTSQITASIGNGKTAQGSQAEDINGQTAQKQAARKQAVAQAKLPQTAHKAVTEPALSPSSLTWGVQVGAFTTFAPAKDAVVKAATRLPTYFDATRPIISQVNSNNGRLYRARLTGLTEMRAREACRELNALALACVVVPPQEMPASALSDPSS